MHIVTVNDANSHNLSPNLHGHATRRLPGNLNVSISRIDGQALRNVLQSTVAVSSESACSSAKTALPSDVLKALGRSDELAFASIRFGIGRFNTETEVDHRVAEITVKIIAKLRQPAYLQPSAAVPLVIKH